MAKEPTVTHPVKPQPIVGESDKKAEEVKPVEPVSTPAPTAGSGREKYVPSGEKDAQATTMRGKGGRYVCHGGDDLEKVE